MRQREFLSQSVEDYMKLIYHIQKHTGKVTAKDIAEQMKVSAASVTSMLKKLAERGAVDYAPYRRITLTRKGETLALEVIRHHRLLELFLQKSLGLSLGRVHEEAERLEHVISEELEERISSSLGHPLVDPHGSPIPGSDGTLIERRSIPLTEADEREALVVLQLTCRSPEMLGYLERLGILPGAKVTVAEKKPYSGPLLIRIGKNRREVIGHELASHVQVVPGRGG